MLIRKKIVFVTGTRADFGKMKPLMRACEQDDDFEMYVFVSGMHMLSKYGETYREVLSEGFRNVELQKGMTESAQMDINLANLIHDFSKYVQSISPDMIIVHGDRIDALAGAIVAMLNNICLGHIEGGEVTGTVDEAIRHAISKMANIHFTANNESLIRLKQLGEDENEIFVIGSPDIDIMLSEQLPSLSSVCAKYEIPYKEYAILLFHPVTSELNKLEEDVAEIIRALKRTGDHYVVIYPNNDTGTDIILRSYEKLKTDEHFMFFPSVQFEDFLTLLKNTRYIIGNSSCGVREACVYGIPAIDIGTRQKNRYSPELLPNIHNVNPDENEIIDAISEIDQYKVASSYFGDGHSTERFMSVLKNEKIWDRSTQKLFFDSPETVQAIRNYHNEVCF